jgi:DNA-binding NarL/FixJ family response regulator
MSTNKVRSKKAKILIVDDHMIVAESIKQMLDHESDLKVCGIAQTSDEALTLVESAKPALIIVDINLKGDVNGIELIKIIKDRHKQVLSVALSMYEEELYAEPAIRAGAKGYVMKSELTQTLLTAIREILNGNIFLSEKMKSRLKIIENDS